MDGLAEGITWFKRSSVRIRRGGLEIHVDPHRVEGSPAYVQVTAQSDKAGVIRSQRVELR